VPSSAHVLQRRVCVFIVFSLASVSPAWAEPPKEVENTPGSVVAIGDVHGDFDDFVAILQKEKLIDAQRHWTGGKTTLVQVGDLLDRGPKPRDVMDLLMTLEKEAPQAGGQVVSLLGNHEVMNIMGDLRYVTPVNFASFADSNSEERQKAAYQAYVKWRSSHMALFAELAQPMELTEGEWMARHPAGYVEQRDAYTPNGIYGKWLREHSALADIGGVIFLHGGISPNVAKMKLAGINTRIRDEIKQFDSAKQFLQEADIILPFFNLEEIRGAVQAEISAEKKGKVSANVPRQNRLIQFLGYMNPSSTDWLSVKVDGPLWFRGYDQWSDEEGSAQMGKILDALKATRIVVGHTVQKGGRIRPRFGDKVFLIDTGMLSTYYAGGRASALQIQDNAKFTADYMDEQVVLEPAQKEEVAQPVAAPR
jgi:hypothetical protein